MAKTTAQKDLLTRVTTLGNEALHKLTDIPGGAKVLDLANESKARLDEMQKKLRGLDALEKRVAKLERQLAATAKKPAASSGTRSSAARSTGSTAKKTTSSSSRSSGTRRPAPKKP